MPRIKKISAQNLHRNWVNIPHVTQFDEADITDMEAFRQAHKDEVAKKGYKLTPIVFLMKAVVAALKEFPLFNTSLSAFCHRHCHGRDGLVSSWWGLFNIKDTVLQPFQSFTQKQIRFSTKMVLQFLKKLGKGFLDIFPTIKESIKNAC